MTPSEIILNAPAGRLSDRLDGWLESSALALVVGHLAIERSDWTYEEYAEGDVSWSGLLEGVDVADDVEVPVYATDEIRAALAATGAKVKCVDGFVLRGAVTYKVLCTWAPRLT